MITDNALALDMQFIRRNLSVGSNNARLFFLFQKTTRAYENPLKSLSVKKGLVASGRKFRSFGMKAQGFEFLLEAWKYQ